MKNDKKIDKRTLVIILYIIQELDGILGKTHLQKLLFLINLRAYKKFKIPLLKLEFEKYKFGPFSYQVDHYINNLKTKKYIHSEETTYNGGKKYVRYYCSKKFANIKEYLSENIELNSKKIALLDEVIDSYGSISLRDLLDIVYNLPSVKETEYCQPIEVAKKIEEEENSYNYFDEFEELLKQ